jgi:hypothetical protein
MNSFYVGLTGGYLPHIKEVALISCQGDVLLVLYFIIFNICSYSAVLEKYKFSFAHLNLFYSKASQCHKNDITLLKEYNWKNIGDYFCRLKYQFIKMKRMS